MTTAGAGARGEGADLAVSGWSERLRPRSVIVEAWRERLRPRVVRIARHPVTKRHTVTSRTSKLVAVKRRKVNKDDDEADDNFKPEHDNEAESLNLEDDEADSCKQRPEYDYPPSPEYDGVEPDYTYTRCIDKYLPCSPSTLKKRVEYTRALHMIKASKALDYYHEKNPDNQHKPVHVNLKHVIFFIETTGYYIHMNFTAMSLKTGDEKLFFAEFFLSYSQDYSQDGFRDYIVTTCVIVGSDSLGGLRNKFDPETRDFMDLKHCYACGDFVKHPEGSTYQAGHRGTWAYDVTDISVE